MRRSALFIAIILFVSSLLLFSQFFALSETPGLIIWGPNPSNPCQGGFAGEAVAIGKPFYDGCSERWAILVPPSEHGNISEQAAYLAQNQASLAGIFLDDFALQNDTTQLSILGAIPQSYSGQVCPVLYPFNVQPEVTLGMPCVLLAMNPRAAFEYYLLSQGGDLQYPIISPVKEADSASVATWLTIIKNATLSIDAKQVMLLAYNMSYSGWPYPIPQNYLTAMSQYTEQNHLWLVYFR